jgi:hypothetical protein
VLREIEAVLNKHAGTRFDKAARWTLTGKDDVVNLRISLEVHKSALEIILDMVTMYASRIGKLPMMTLTLCSSLAKDIKSDTHAPLTDTAEIIEDTAHIPQILTEIARLRA